MLYFKGLSNANKKESGVVGSVFCRRISICRYMQILILFESNLKIPGVAGLFHFQMLSVFLCQVYLLLCKFTSLASGCVLGDVSDSDKSSLWRGILFLCPSVPDFTIEKCCGQGIVANSTSRVEGGIQHSRSWRGCSFCF